MALEDTTTTTLPVPSTSTCATTATMSPSPPLQAEGEQDTTTTTAHNAKKVGRGRKGKGKAKVVTGGEIQFIHHLTECTSEALTTFVELGENWYQNKSIGRTKQQEDTMVCDCTWKPGDDPTLACSEDSGCINFLTQVECISTDCRCGEACLNQRFERKQFAPIEIVQTEKKGFGMRAKINIQAETFIYEYIGEVVGEKAFQRRMKEYTSEGLRHFYFMQLQREEFIDATKKGGLGRFLNHSCNPNCYIAKWVVGRQMRMGIFAKRDVQQGEELTFNYNVDRYGHEAQECYCGEFNCVGYLGGKTQTDVGAMDDLYLDALGITDDVEAMSLKGNKSKRSRKMDVDYIPVMKPIPFKDVPRVASAIRQSCSTRRILSKLIRRIQITEDLSVQKQLMRLHGFSLMSMVMNEYPEDEEIIQTTLEILLKWPLITKNKLVSTNIEETVVNLQEHSVERIQFLAAELVKMWVDLEISYRIPKAKVQSDVDAPVKRLSFADFEDLPSKRPRLDSVNEESETIEIDFKRPEPARARELKPEEISLPKGWTYVNKEGVRPHYYHSLTETKLVSPPTTLDATRAQQRGNLISQEAKFKAQAKAVDVKDIVARAKAEAEVACAAAAKVVEEEREKKKVERLMKKEKSKLLKSEEKKSVGKCKEKKVMGLFSSVVVKTMSRYKDSIDHDQFKKRAKEVTDILCQKEQKSSHYSTEVYNCLSPEKEAKIKAFVKDWMIKLLTRKGIPLPCSTSSRQRHLPLTLNSTCSTLTSSLETPTPTTPTTTSGASPTFSSFHQLQTSLSTTPTDFQKELINDIVGPDGASPSSSSSASSDSDDEEKEMPLVQGDEQAIQSVKHEKSQMDTST